MMDVAGPAEWLLKAAVVVACAAGFELVLVRVPQLKALAADVAQLVTRQSSDLEMRAAAVAEEAVKRWQEYVITFVRGLLALRLMLLVLQSRQAVLKGFYNSDVAWDMLLGRAGGNAPLGPLVGAYVLFTLAGKLKIADSPLKLDAMLLGLHLMGGIWYWQLDGLTTIHYIQVTSTFMIRSTVVCLIFQRFWSSAAIGVVQVIMMYAKLTQKVVPMKDWDMVEAYVQLQWVVVTRIGLLALMWLIHHLLERHCITRLAQDALLDSATDGWCQVGVDGEITECSHQLEETFGQNAKNGELLPDLAATTQDKHQLESLVNGERSEPVLVIFHGKKENTVVDVKVIPVLSTSRELRACMQVVGEPRMRTDTPLPVVHHDIDAEDSITARFEEEEDAATLGGMTSILEEESDMITASSSLAYTATTFRSARCKSTTCESGMQTELAVADEIATQTDPVEPQVPMIPSKRPPRPISLSPGSTCASSPTPSESLGSGAVDDFQCTPAFERKRSMLKLMSQWCCSNETIKRHCCPYHGQLSAVASVVKSLKNSHCNPLWSPLLAGQCQKCGFLLASEKGACMNCTPALAAKQVSTAQINGLLSSSLRASVDATSRRLDIEACTGDLQSLLGEAADSDLAAVLGKPAVASIRQWLLPLHTAASEKWSIESIGPHIFGDVRFEDEHGDAYKATLAATLADPLVMDDETDLVTIILADYKQVLEEA